MNDAAYVAQRLSIHPESVERALDLLDEGNTVPFIARYRKEVTRGLDEVDLRRIASEAERFRALTARKAEVLRLIQEQNKLTPEIAAAVESAQTLQAVEDQYRPYRPRRRTRAAIARERGLQPLAEQVLRPQSSWEAIEALAVRAAEHPEVGSVEAALAGASDITAEYMADDPATRDEVRSLTHRFGVLTCGCILAGDRVGERTPYESYYDFSRPVRELRSHQILAINRGEREEVLRVSLHISDHDIVAAMSRRWIGTDDKRVANLLRNTIQDSYTRLLGPSIEREIRHSLTESASARAIEVFAHNLEALLMQPPVRGKRVLGIDPGYRTGCKLAVVDETGRVLTTGVMYPHPPHNRIDEAKAHVRQWVTNWAVTLIVIGNGTASRETEILVAEVIQDLSHIQYLMVSEAGASVYSASELAREEFPLLDVSERGTVSIARRVQDPLAELVKIDPKSIGIGQYQHDVDQKELAHALRHVVESVVNRVGVHLNTASGSLLQYVAGINSTLSRRIVEYRDAHGPFTSRNDLLRIKGLGAKTFEQAAGFLRISDGIHPFDNTAVHPESYEVATKVLEAAGLTRDSIHEEGEAKKALRCLDPAQVAEKLDAGIPTITDIIEALLRPGLDPRTELPPPLFRRDVLHMEDLKPGMHLTGSVSNVVDFGVFVDLGLKKAGLIHISRLGLSYIKHPLDVVSVGQPVEVEVIDVDLERGRISLALVPDRVHGSVL